MPADTPVKALILAFTDAPSLAAYVINRLQPELLCFFVPESAKTLVEEAVQPLVQQMPKRWDSVVTPDPADVIACHQALSRSIHDLFRNWAVQVGEVVVDLTGATPAMAAALATVSQPWTSRVISLVDAEGREEGEAIAIGGLAKYWLQGNPWDESAVVVRREASDAFNHGSFRAAATLFHTLEARVSGGQKPLYRALGELALGYGLWEQFHYRQAWDKLKTSLKALDMASLWGGPPGLKALLPLIKANNGNLLLHARVYVRVKKTNFQKLRRTFTMSVRYSYHCHQFTMLTICQRPLNCRLNSTPIKFSAGVCPYIFQQLLYT